MSKRFLALLMSLILIISLFSACGSSKDDEESEDNKENTANNTPSPSPTPATTPTPAVTPATPTPVASPVFEPAQVATLAISVYRKNSNGQQVVTPPDYPFRSGDQVRLAFTSPTDGYLYLVLKGSSGKIIKLYPDSRIDKGSNAIRANQQIIVPADLWFTMDKTPGTELVYAIFSKERDKEKTLFDSIEQVTKTTPVAQSSPAASNADLEIQVLKQLESKAGGAVKSSSSAPAIGKDITLEVKDRFSVAAIIKLKHDTD